MMGGSTVGKGGCMTGGGTGGVYHAQWEDDTVWLDTGIGTSYAGYIKA